MGAARNVDFIFPGSGTSAVSTPAFARPVAPAGLGVVRFGGSAPYRIVRAVMTKPARVRALPGSLAATGLQQHFRQLATQWHAETQHCSMVWQYVHHDAYQRIMAMGTVVLPLILKDLGERGGHWFHALEMISGENPAVSARSRSEAIQAWLEWGRIHQLLQ
jgi:hypothetical protein